MKIFTTVYAAAVRDTLELLPFFLDHYSTQGITHFHIGVHNGSDSPLWSELETICSRYSTHIECSYRGGYDPYQNWLYKRWACNAYTTKREWFAVADIDELHQYADGSLHHTVDNAEREGADCIKGRFLDRVAEGGRLIAIIPSRPIWQQFPYGCQITKNVMGAWAEKIMLMRGRFDFDEGHHRAFDAQNKDARSYSRMGIIHHFKWQQGVLERLIERNEALSESPWGGETERFLAYFREHGHINLSDTLLETRFYGDLSGT